MRNEKIIPWAIVPPSAEQTIQASCCKIYEIKIL